MSEVHAQYEKEVTEFFANLPDYFFEPAQCIFCPQSLHTILFVKGPMCIVRCKSCGFVYNHRQPKQTTLDDFYSQSRAMIKWADLKNTGDDERQNAKFRPTVDLIKIFGIRSVLDVGCGTGKFLSLLPDYIHRHGVDQHEPSLAIARKSGVETTLAPIDGFFKDNPIKYEFITGWGVLEHYKHPHKLLKYMYEALQDGGYVVLCVPNFHSEVVQALGKECFTFCPQHLYYFNPTNLTRLLLSAGFSFVNFCTIEPESRPCIRKWQGNDPYGDSPLNLMTVYELDRLSLCFNKGYKIVIMGRKTLQGSSFDCFNSMPEG